MPCHMSFSRSRSKRRSSKRRSSRSKRRSSKRKSSRSRKSSRPHGKDTIEAFPDYEDIEHYDRWKGMSLDGNLYYLTKKSRYSKTTVVKPKIVAEEIYRIVNGGGAGLALKDLRRVRKYHEKHNNVSQIRDVDMWIERIKKGLYTGEKGGPNRKPKYLKKSRK